MPGRRRNRANRAGPPGGTVQTVQAASSKPRKPCKPGEAFQLGEVWRDMQGRRHRVGPCETEGLVELIPIDDPKLGAVGMAIDHPWPWMRISAAPPKERPRCYHMEAGEVPLQSPENRNDHRNRP